MSAREPSRHPRRRSKRPRLAFSGTLDLRLERAMERHLQHRFAQANARALRQRHGEAPPTEWLGPTTPFAALVLACQRGDFERGLPDLDSAVIAWRLTSRGWTRLDGVPDPRRKPWWSGVLAFALSPDRVRLAVLESWQPGQVASQLFTLIWHEGWLELLPVRGA